MKLNQAMDKYEPSEKDFEILPMSMDERNRIIKGTLARAAHKAHLPRKKGKVALVAAVAVLTATMTVTALALGTDIFERALGNDASKYQNNINVVGENSAFVEGEGYTLGIHSTIFTDNDVYAVLAVKGTNLNAEELAVKGRIVFPEVDQTLFGLVGHVEALEPQEGDEDTLYFLYSATIATTSLGADNQELYIAAGGGSHFLKYNSLKDYEGFKLELTVSLKDKDNILSSTVSRVSAEALSFHPDPALYKGEYYETVMITPYVIKLRGQSTKTAEELEALSALPWDDSRWYWFEPDISLTLLLEGGEEIRLEYNTEDRIAAQKAGTVIPLIKDERYPVGGSASGNPDDGRFSAEYNFRNWELDLAKVKGVVIDGVLFEVNP